jgi:hypothetical protein
MADADVATKAPESDAQESSNVIAGDSKPDQGAASLGVCTFDSGQKSSIREKTDHMS